MTDAALAVLAPTPDETLLLRACLPTGAPGRAAFGEWADRVGDPVQAMRDARPAVTALMPALLRATEANGARPDRSLAKMMRAAWTHEEARGERFEAACREIVTGLETPAVVLPGVSLVATVYGEWPLRHCHDLDLLVNSGAGQAFHSSGTPVVRHVRLAEAPWLDLPVEDAWSRASTAALGDARILVLSDTDTLAHICVHAASLVSPQAPGWVIDAWTLVTRGNVDWRILLELATPRLAPILNVQLSWLADELAAPIPASVLTDLDRAARGADRLSLELSLYLARRRVGAPALVRHAGRDRREVLRATLAPSRRYLDHWGITRREWARRAATKLLRSRGPASAPPRSRRESSRNPAPRAAGTQAHPPRAR